MIDREKLPEFIDRFNSKKLHGKDLEEFLEMLKNDPGLKLDVKLDKDLNEMLAEKDIIELRRKIIKYRIPEERDGIGLGFFLFAASVAIIIGLAVFVFLWLRRIDSEELKSGNEFNMADTASFSKNIPVDDEGNVIKNATTDTILKGKGNGRFIDEDELLFADNYSTFPPYESLVGETSRSGNFRLLKPAVENSYRKGSVVIFNWEAPSNDKLSIIITNNKGKDVFASRTITGTSFALSTSKFSEGLYYFKFVNNDDIIYFGKFTLR